MTGLDRRSPGNWNLPVTGSALLDVDESGERQVVGLDQQLLAGGHVVNLVAGLLRGARLQRQRHGEPKRPSPPMVDDGEPEVKPSAHSGTSDARRLFQSGLFPLTMCAFTASRVRRVSVLRAMPYRSLAAATTRSLPKARQGGVILPCSCGA